MKDNKAEVKVAFSNKAGAAFNNPIRIDEDKPIGRVDVAMLDSSSAMVSWMEGSSIKAIKVYADGRKDSPMMIATSSEGRSGGFPQMTKAGNKLFFAWVDDKAKKIRVAQMEI